MIITQAGICLSANKVNHGQAAYGYLLYTIRIKC